MFGNELGICIWHMYIFGDVGWHAREFGLIST